MPITCWYSGTAFIALLQACRIENLSKDANEGLNILTNAVEQLQRMWGSANIIRQGFERLRQPVANGSTKPTVSGLEALPAPNASHIHDFPITGRPHDGPDLTQQDFDWTALFPFVTSSTNRIAESLLPGSEPGITTRFPSPENMLFHDTLMTEYHDLLEPFAEYNSLDFSDMGLAA
jgi:hypothetical protein